MALRLKGKRIVVTRSRKQAGCLIRALEKQGAEVIAIPPIEIQDPVDPRPLEKAAAEAGEYDLVIFTSSSTVENFGKLFSGKPPRIPAACIGPITSATARKNGWRVLAEAEEYTIQGLVKAIARAL